MGMMGGPPPGSYIDYDRQPEYEYDGPDRIVQQVVMQPGIDRNFIQPMMQAPQAHFEMEPEFMERVIEIPRVTVEHRELLVEIPQPQVVDRIIEVPQIQEIIKELPGNVIELPLTREAPVIEFCQEVIEGGSNGMVSNIQYVDRYIEVPQIQEVLRIIPRVEVREIPIERIIQVPKKIIQEIERPVFRPVPHLVQQAVERQIPVPRTQIQTLEVVKQIPYQVDQMVDVQVNYPMPVPTMMPQPTMIQQVPVPYGQPYAVEVEKRVEVPVLQTQVVEKIVEVPVAVPVYQQPPVQKVVPQYQVQHQEIVHEPYEYGERHEVSRRVMGTQNVAQRASETVRIVQPAATPPMSVQQVPRTQIQYSPSTNLPSSVIGASQRVGAMTPPTPPVFSRSLGSAPIYGGPAEMIASSMPPRTLGSAPVYGGPGEMIASNPYASAPGTMFMGGTAPAAAPMTIMPGTAPMTRMPGTAQAPMTVMPGTAPRTLMPGTYGSPMTIPSGVPTPPMPPRTIS